MTKNKKDWQTTHRHYNCSELAEKNNINSAVTTKCKWTLSLLVTWFLRLNMTYIFLLDGLKTSLHPAKVRKTVCWVFWHFSLCIKWELHRVTSFNTPYITLNFSLFLITVMILVIVPYCVDIYLLKSYYNKIQYQNYNISIVVSTGIMLKKDVEHI